MATRFDFETQREQSAIKTKLVVKHFNAWAQIMKSRSKYIGYVDLFAGPGIYEDGMKSTPIYILDTCIAKEVLLELESENMIECFPPNRRKNTLGDNVKLIFK